MNPECGWTRRVLGAGSGPRPLTANLEAAQAHLAGCPACRAFMAEMDGFAGVVRRHAPRPGAPAAVRERLFRAVALARTMLPPPRLSRRGTPVKLLAAVAGAALIVAAGWAVQRSTRDEPARASLLAVAEDHARGLQHEAIFSDDPREVAEWLGTRVPYAVPVPELPGAVLEGARLCLVGGERGAAVRFRVDGHPVSYYVMPAPERGGGDDARFIDEAEAGYAVVAWRQDALRYALVGDLPRARLARLARDCHEQVAGVTSRERP